MNVDAPDPRNYGQETRDTLQAQIDLMPQRYAAESQYGPQFAQLQSQILRTALLGDQGLLSTLEEVQPRFAAMNRDAQAAQREADLADVARLGPQAVAALRSADPQQKALVDTLNAQAQQELAAGSGLTPGLEQQVTQQVRASQASRGLGFGLPDAVTEAFTLGDRGIALQRQRQAFAGDVARLNQATVGDPFLAILGRPSNAGAAAQGFLGQGQQQASMSGPRLFNPESQYAMDLNNTNFNANAAADIASANATSGIIGDGLSAL
jgi:hypothetical protein